MAIAKADVVRAVRKVGQQGRHFLYREVRDELRIPAQDKAGANRTRNWLQSLVTDGAIALVSGGKRKRNKYYNVQDDQKLQAGGAIPTGRSNGAPADRLSDRLTRIESTLEAIDSKVTQLVSLWT
jgi:hypothetical protein